MRVQYIDILLVITSDMSDILGKYLSSEKVSVALLLVKLQLKQHGF